VPDWISVNTAVAQILETVAPLAREDIPLNAAVGRTLAEDIVSPIDHPPWDNSAMDGFAVRAEDVRGAARATPVLLDVIEEVAAGAFPTKVVGRGQAVRIMTGGPVPEGADGVVRIEHTDVIEEGRIRVLDDMDAGRNVRPRGEDVRTGERLFTSGRRLRPGEIGILASIGCARVSVRRQARVALLATGDELVEIERFDEVRAGRRIVNSNSYALAAAVRTAGAEPLDLGIARDDPVHVRALAARGMDADVLVTTAGASVGDHDVVKDALGALGLDLVFWRVTMRPGSPVSFGTIMRADGSRLPVFGLPGNPVSALVTFDVLVRPALRRMHGRADVFGRTIQVRAAERMSSTAKLTHFLRVTLEPAHDGVPLARLTGGQGSGILSSVARADALLVIPLGVSVLEEAELATALLLPAPDDGQEHAGYMAGSPTIAEQGRT
jgi:molybdopterin molybdotransferase